jgi:hypothetical protein
MQSCSFPSASTREPVVEDIRSSAKFEFHHPRCFADRFGVDALIAAVRREDMRRTRRL